VIKNYENNKIESAENPCAGNKCEVLEGLLK
jgi:hypothetical protein